MREQRLKAIQEIVHSAPCEQVPALENLLISFLTPLDGDELLQDPEYVAYLRRLHSALRHFRELDPQKQILH